MKELVEYIAKGLVENEDAVSVAEKEDGKTIALELTVASDDMGKVIGKGGKIVRAIRTVVKAASIKSGKKASLEILQ